MYEVTKDNYHIFLTYHGLNPEVAAIVVNDYDKTESYFNMMSVRLWVEASKYAAGIKK